MSLWLDSTGSDVFVCSRQTGIFLTLGGSVLTSFVGVGFYIVYAFSESLTATKKTVYLFFCHFPAFLFLPSQ